MMEEIEGVRIEGIIKDLTLEELERLKIERYEKFIKPLMKMDMKALYEFEKNT